MAALAYSGGLRPRRASVVRAILGRLVWVAVLGTPVLLGAAAGRGALPADATAFFPGCAPASSFTLVVGTVTCQQVPSPDLGGTTAFSYFVPPQCAPDALVGSAAGRCPVLYLLHGFGGDYTSELGTAQHPSAMVDALDAGPPVDPTATPTPWQYADPGSWVPMAPLGMVLVAPDGRTVPGGDGPAPGLDGFWMDWNPRYARGGDQEAYATPAPRFEDSLLQELIPFVDTHFPVGTGRAWQALQGTSLGGFGAYKDGLQHPDIWASIGSISGALNFLIAPGPQPVPVASPLSVTVPPAPAQLEVPGVVSAHAPVTSLPAPAEDFAVALYALGDPVADQTFYRGNMPVDLAENGHASAGDSPSLDIRGFSNDAVPRQASDLSNPASYVSAQVFESLVLDMNLQMESAFALAGVPNDYQLHPGIHEDAYWNPYLRHELEGQYAHLMHADATGSPPPPPTAFDYRSIATSFDVWGWTVSVERPAVDFLDMTDVSCQGLTLQGTGVVSVTVPPSCGTGYAGATTFRVDLGPAPPVDDGPDLAAVPAYGGTAHVILSPLA